MKPVYLSMEGFGPYKNKTEIDFTRLGDKGIYLITGDTGAGKTTIFDAITYALYNETSGNGRDPDMMYSKYLSDNEPSTVEFVFLYRDKQYKITRTIKPGKSTVKKSAAMEMPDGTLIEGASNVTDKCEEILGIKREQFTQIAMIAQGDFLKLIRAKSDERRKIFSDIFNTGNYTSLEERIKADASAVQRDYEDICEKITAAFGNSVCGENECLGELESLKAQSCTYIVKNGKSLLDKIIRLDEDGKAADEEKKSSLNSRRDLLNALKERAESSKNNRLAAEKARKIADENRPLLKERENNYLLLQQDTQRDELTKQITLEKDRLSEYDEYNRLLGEAGAKEKALANLEKKLALAEKQALSHEEKLRLSKEKLLELKDAEKEHTEIKAEYNRLCEENHRLEALKKSKTDFHKLEKDLKKAQSEYMALSEKSNAADHIFKSLQKAFLDEQAGILAKSLKDGEKCPVCGSTSHPFPAVLTENAPDEKAVKDAETNAKTASELTEAASRSASSLKGKLEEKKENLLKEAKEFFGTAEIGLIDEQLEKAEADYAAKIAASEAKLEEAGEKAEQKKLLEASQPQLEENLRLSAENKNALSLSIAAARAECDNAKAAAKNCGANLKYSSLAEAKESISNKENRLAELNRQLDNAKTDFESLRTLIEENLTKAKAYEESVNPDDEKKGENAAAELEKLNGEISALEESIQLAAVRISGNKTVSKQLEEYSRAFEKISQRLKIVQPLADVVCGKIDGETKIRFETYILSGYLDRILVHASSRLSRMTDGQYTLERRTADSNRKSQQGLDIDVYDRKTGSSRPVHSLSGGESFMASLSMALGLSDEIQQSAGGIKLDTMFIDEGFGSLSDEALNNAIDVLNDLSDGCKSIGIISHVESLKTRIDKQISVTKSTAGGSSVKLIV
ncbi:MAG: AAA family ATPase [Ruminiclostridium sp.]